MDEGPDVRGVRQRVAAALSRAQDFVHRVLTFEAEGVQGPPENLFDRRGGREAVGVGRAVEGDRDLRPAALVAVDVVAMVDVGLVEFVVVLPRLLLVFDDEHQFVVIIRGDAVEQLLDGQPFADAQELGLAVVGGVDVNFDFFHDVKAVGRREGAGVLLGSRYV